MVIWAAPAGAMPMMPGVIRRLERPSRVATSTAPSTTWTDAPSLLTLTLKVVPFTTAARKGVLTAKWGADFFSTLKSALPRS